MAKTKKPRKPVAIHGFVIGKLDGEYYVSIPYAISFFGAKKIKSIANWFLKAADWIEAQEKKE